MQANRKNQRYSYSIFLSIEFRIDALEESTEFFNVAFRNKFDTTIIFHNLHFLTGAKIQRLPYCLWYDDLIFR